jgi:hypothetical protein
MPKRKDAFKTLSGLPINDIYTAADVQAGDLAKKIGFPGEYPFANPGPHGWCTISVSLTVALMCSRMRHRASHGHPGKGGAEV